MPVDTESEPQPAPVAAPAPVAQPQDSTSALYRAALGSMRADDYLPVFDAMDASERAFTPHWNWAASLCTFNWLVYRQLWNAALYYAGTVVATILLLLGIGRLIFHFSTATELALTVLAGVLFFIVPGFFGNVLLHRQCRRRMTHALRTSDDEAQARALLERQACTPRRLQWIIAANAFGLLLLGFVTYQWTSFATKVGSADQPIVASDALPPQASKPITIAPAAVTSAPPATAASTPDLLPAPVASAAITPATPVSAPVAITASASAAPPPKRAESAPAVAKESAVKPAPVASQPALQTVAGPSPTASASAPSVWINVGLFAQEGNALAAHRKLLDAGLPAAKQLLDTAAGQRTRVRAGPFSNRSDAQAAVEKIRGLSLEAVIVAP